MRSYLDCVPCFFQQAVRAARLVGLDETTSRQLLDELGRLLPSIDASDPPPQNAAFLYRRLAELSGRVDPFADVKAEHTELALSLMPAMQHSLKGVADLLDACVRLAAAGNILDLGALSEVGDVGAVLRRALESEHTRWDIEALRRALTAAGTVLVLGDNAGETVFDRVMMEALGRLFPAIELSYAVRGGPIINDATIDDALAAGIDEVATIVTTGSALPGIVIDDVSVEFRALLRDADVVIAKGQGNFETLSEVAREVFFILTVKCRVVAAHLALPRGASALIHHRP